MLRDNEVTEIMNSFRYMSHGPENRGGCLVLCTYWPLQIYPEHFLRVALGKNHIIGEKNGSQDSEKHEYIPTPRDIFYTLTEKIYVVQKHKNAVNFYLFSSRDEATV